MSGMKIYNQIREVYRLKANFLNAEKYYMFFYEQGWYDKSFEQYTAIMKSIKAYYSSEHFITASTIMNIGNVYAKKKFDYENSLVSYQQCLLILQKLFPSGQHLDIAICTDNVGNISLLMEKFNLALDMYKNVVSIESYV